MTEAELGSEIKILVYRTILNEQIILRHKADRSLNLFGIAVNVDSIDQYLALRWLFVPVEHMKQGTFAGTASTHQCHQITRLFHHRYIAQAKPSILKLKRNIFCFKACLVAFVCFFESRHNASIINGIVCPPSNRAAGC